MIFQSQKKHIHGLLLSFSVMFLCYFSASIELWRESAILNVSERPSALIFALEAILFGGVVNLLPFCACLPIIFDGPDPTSVNRKHGIGFNFCLGGIAVTVPFVFHTLIWNLIAVPVNPLQFESHQLQMRGLIGTLYGTAYGIPLYAIFSAGMFLCGGTMALICLASYARTKDPSFSFVLPALTYFGWLKLALDCDWLRLPTPVDLFNEGLTIHSAFSSFIIYLFISLLCAKLYQSSQNRFKETKPNIAGLEKYAQLHDFQKQKNISLFILTIMVLCAREISRVYSKQLVLEYELSVWEYMFMVLSKGAYMPDICIIFLLFQQNKPDFQSIDKYSTKLSFIKDAKTCVQHAAITSGLLLLTALVLSCLVSHEFNRAWTFLSLDTSKPANLLIPQWFAIETTPLFASLLALLIIFLFLLNSGLFLSIARCIHIEFLGWMLYLLGIFGDSIWIETINLKLIPSHCFSLKAILSCSTMQSISGILQIVVYQLYLFVLLILIHFLIDICSKHKHVQIDSTTLSKQPEY